MVINYRIAKIARKQPCERFWAGAGKKTVRETTKNASQGILRTIWGIETDFIDAWGTVVCWALLLGVKMGLWRLRRATEPKGWPHATRKLAGAIICGVFAWGSWTMLMLAAFGG